MVTQTPIAAKVPIDGPVTCSDRDVAVTSIVKSSLPSEDQASFHFSLQNLDDGPRGNLSNMESSRFSSSKLSGKREKNMPGDEMENKPHTAAANQVWLCRCLISVCYIKLVAIQQSFNFVLAF